MTLFFRMLQLLLAAPFLKRLKDFGETHSWTFRVMPSDLDLFVHMNNSKYLNYMEVARWGLVVRAGFFWSSIKRGWTSPIAKIDIRFLRPLRFWQKFTVTAQVIAMTDRWLFIHQTFHSRDKIVAHAMVKSIILGREGVIPPVTFLKVLGLQWDQVQVPAEIRGWFEEFSSDSHGRQRSRVSGKGA